DLQQAIKEAPILKTIDYELDEQVKLSVDTSYIAIGWYISIPERLEKKKWDYVQFGSTIMAPREACYSQPKRELFGLNRALDTNKYYLIGCRKLIVETDAKYIKGMLNNPRVGPNATINQWI
ncbi:hypothetical protein FA15DRAFT_547164, partial [Coprinopsis marcescibilis]